MNVFVFLLVIFFLCIGNTFKHSNNLYGFTDRQAFLHRRYSQCKYDFQYCIQQSQRSQKSHFCANSNSSVLHSFTFEKYHQDLKMTWKDKDKMTYYHHIINQHTSHLKERINVSTR